MAIRDAVRDPGLEMRPGLRTGEIEVEPDDISGIAVHIGARISALANGGEVLVSGTVKDLVVGSGLGFEDRGTHSLKGCRAIGGCSRLRCEVARPLAATRVGTSRTAWGGRWPPGFRCACRELSRR